MGIDLKFKENIANSGMVGFSLAEVLITLGIVGVVAAITLPVLVGKHQEKTLVTALLKFHSTLAQTVEMLIVKNDGASITNIISNRDNEPTAFENVAKEMKIIDKCYQPNCSTVSWLPDYSYDYLGNIGNNVSFGAVAKHGYGNACYLLTDGAAFCLDVNPNGYCVTVDVNGKTKPNRVGRDIFSFTVGGDKGAKVEPYEYHSAAVLTSHGVCMAGNKCNPMNLDPAKDGGASPTTYVLLTGKLPPIYKK